MPIGAHPPTFVSNPNWPGRNMLQVMHNPATDGIVHPKQEMKHPPTRNPDSNGTTIVVDNNTTSPSDNNVTNPGISPTPNFRPLVRTRKPARLPNSATSGMILDDGDANISEAGF